MFVKSKIFITLAFTFTMIFATNTEAHYQQSISTPNFSVTDNAHSIKPIELASKHKFRCKLCGKVFNTGIVCAGHIRGNHGKWLIHKYYEKI